MADADTVKTAVNPSPDLGETTVYDRDGDLTLIAGADEHRALVCSRAMSRASPVFKLMLNGPFSEYHQNAEKGKPWIVRLPEDNWQATNILLSIIHGKFDRIPVDLPIHEFHDLLIFTDKYDMTNLIVPWVKAWMPEFLHWQDGTTYLFTITIAWELGDIELLEDCVRGAIETCSLGPDGRILFSDGDKAISFEELDLPLFPQGLLDGITTARENIAAAFLHELRGDISEFLANVGHTNSQGYTTSSYERLDICYAAEFGVLISCLTKLFNDLRQPELLSYLLSNEPKPHDPYKGSLKSAHDALAKIELYSVDGILSHDHQISILQTFFHHHINSHGSVVTERMQALVSERAGKLGIDWGKHYYTYGK